MNIMKFAINTNTNGKGYKCAIARQIQLREQVWLTWCVCVLHDQTNTTLDLFAMKRYHRLFARTLDPKTNWYAFNDSARLYQPKRNQQQNIAFKKLAPGDVCRITQARRCLRQRWKSRTIQLVRFWYKQWL
jgi:hypothetical protein